MLSETYTLKELHEIPLEKQVEKLLKALNIQKENPHRSTTACIALALDIPSFPKVSRILAKEGYQLTLLFKHGEARTIDFQQFFKTERQYDRILLEQAEQFDKVEVENDTLVWREVGFWSKNPDGEDQFMYYDIDPALLYEAGRPTRVGAA
jgi:hypothetical protein